MNSTRKSSPPSRERFTWALKAAHRDARMHGSQSPVTALAKGMVPFVREVRDRGDGAAHRARWPSSRRGRSRRAMPANAAPMGRKAKAARQDRKAIRPT